MPEYPYRKLQGRGSIRLLRIEPGQGLEQIRCHLIHTSLCQRPLYHALSYTWGSSGDPESILCDNIKMNVTKNLHSSLIQFRHNNETRIMWIDAVCINQNNKDEKTEQIRLMKEIYSLAERVWIWLGCEQVGDAEGLAVLLKLERFIRWYRGELDNLPPHPPGKSLPLHIPKVAARFHAMGVSRQDWSCLNKFFQRAWFTRAWVIQEAVKAADNPLPTLVVCGRLELPWNKLAYTAEGILSLGLFFIYGSGSLQGLGYHAVGMIESLRRNRKKSVPDTLLTLLNSTRETRATDPRDKIFALYGLVHQREGDHPLLLPSYNKSCAQVYTDAAIYFLEEYQSLAPLQRVAWTLPQNGGFGGIEGLPSWVPDWSKRHPFIPLESQFYSAGGYPKASFRLSTNGAVLSIKGRILDRIDELMSFDIVTQDQKEKQTPETFALLKSTLEYKRRWYKFCVSASCRLTGRTVTEDIPFPSSQDSYPTGETLQEAFWRTLVCNKNMQGQKVGEEYGSYWKIVHRLYSCDDVFENMPSHDEIMSMMLFEQPMDMFAEGRRFCTTVNGRIGWVPQRASLGDFVCVFLGYPVPFIIRKAFFREAHLPFMIRPATTYFQLVGECYIHGYMEGEGLNHPFDLEEINLR